MEREKTGLLIIEIAFIKENCSANMTVIDFITISTIDHLVKVCLKPTQVGVQKWSINSK